MNVNPVNVRDADEIESAIENFARTPNGGLIVTAGGAAHSHRDLIIALTDRYKLPAIYYESFFVAGGGLISYGARLIDQYRHAAGYVDRILKGEKPADLPVQAPTKFELVINLKTAKALGLDHSADTARPRRRGDRMSRRRSSSRCSAGGGGSLAARRACATTSEVLSDKLPRTASRRGHDSNEASFGTAA